MNRIVPVILAGGSGSRLWPLSRPERPKPFLPLLSDRTLLQETVARLDGLVDGVDIARLADPVIVCRFDHRELATEQLQQIGCNTACLILEPAGRNTAPALTLAALGVAEEDPDAVMLVLPADHAMADSRAFHDAVRRGMPHAVSRRIVTFGVRPTRMEPAYGYIQCGRALDDGAMPMVAFREKPDPETVRDCLDAGDFLWNSGIFLLAANTWLDTVRTWQPEMLAVVEKAWQAAVSDEKGVMVPPDPFLDCPAVSIDYAVLEKIPEADVTNSPMVMSLEAGWSDVGTWAALWAHAEKDAASNLVSGAVNMHEVAGCMIRAGQRRITMFGIEDLIVVDADDELLIMPRSEAYRINECLNGKAAAIPEDMSPAGNVQGESVS